MKRNIIFEEDWEEEHLYDNDKDYYEFYKGDNIPQRWLDFLEEHKVDINIVKYIKIERRKLKT